MIMGFILFTIGGLLVIAEMNTLTFYLLAVAVACFAAGGGALVGLGVVPTLGIFGGVVLLGLPLARIIRRRLRNPESEQVSQDDAGHLVTVKNVSQDCLEVTYRGTVWQARMALGETLGDDPHATLRIRSREGNVLWLERVRKTP
ncbi:MAG: NfeD family protein [Acidiferrobacter sp.]